MYSTFSSDSGNVADYYESSERAGLHPLPKSRSMPDYMENYTGKSCGEQAVKVEFTCVQWLILNTVYKIF